MLSMMPKTPFATTSAGSGIETSHYKPLNGRSLRDIAQEKLHHNSGGFTNPLGMNREGRFWEVMKWKLFSNNQFKNSLTRNR